MRTRATVAGLTSSAAPMAASVQPGPAWPWLALSRMRAWVSALAGAMPRPIMVCSRARSCSDRTTTCRLRTSASCDGIPGPHEHETEPHIPQVTTDELLGTSGGWAGVLPPPQPDPCCLSEQDHDADEEQEEGEGGGRPRQRTVEDRVQDNQREQGVVQALEVLPAPG